MLAPMIPSPMNPTFMVAPPRELWLRVENLGGDAGRRHGGGPTGIERQVGDDFADLVLGHAVGESALEVTLELVAPVHGHEGGHGDEAPVALGQSRALPHVAVQHLLAQVDELGHRAAHFVSRRGCRCGRGHVFPPVERSLSLRGGRGQGEGGGSVQAILMMPGSICWKRSATCGSWPATTSFSFPASASMVSKASSISGRLVMICTGWRVSTLW